MKPVISNYAWIHKNEVDSVSLRKMLMKDLTLSYQDDYTTKNLSLYKLDGEFVGIPRMYFMKYFQGYTYVDQTSFPVKDDYPKFQGKLRSGQDKAVKEVLEKFDSPYCYGGLLQAATGSGKTITALSLIATLKTPTIVLLHKTDLVEQWKNRINEFLPDAKVKLVRQNELDFYGADIVLGMYQTVLSRYETLRDKGLFSAFGLCIHDEVHHVGADTLCLATTLFKPRYRFGLSATIGSRRDGFDNAYFWNLGNVLTKMRSEKLTGMYYQIGYKPLISVPTFKSGKVNLGKMITVLTKQPARNNFIVGEVLKARDAGRKILVLTDRREHAHTLVNKMNEKLLNDVGYSDAGLFLGNMKQEELDEATKKSIMVASYGIASEGTDIPELDTLFLTTPRSDIHQSVGRILRVYKEKKKPIVVDLVDKVSVGFALAKKRQNEYDRMGFKNGFTKQNTI